MVGRWTWMSQYDVNSILKEMLSNISDSYAKTVGFPMYDLTAAFAIESAALYKRADEIEAKLDIENLTGNELTRRVYQLTGVQRRPAVYAVGEITVTGKGTVPEGSLFCTQDNIQYKTTEAAVIDGSGKIPIMAVYAGESGNVGAGSITKIPVTIAGITAVTNEQPTRNGYREENDKELRQRFYDALQKPIVSGNKNHYIKWAEEVAGVGKAKCFSLAFGENTVEICIIGNDGQPASAELIEAVQNYIDPGSTGKGEGEAPAGAYCTVTTATKKTLDITATLVLLEGYELESVKESVTDSITELLKSKAFQVEYISYAAIANIIFETPGVIDYQNMTINSATANIPVGEREVAVVGVVNFSE